MAVLIRRSTGGGGGGGSFTADSGFGSAGSFNNGQSFTLTRGAGGFGTGPNIVLFADGRGGTPSADVGLSQTIGAFTSTVAAAGQKPYYSSGARDGNTCINTMTDAMGAANTNSQCQIYNIPDFDTFYCAHAVYGDFPTADQGNTNQKTIWFGRDGHFADGQGHDIYLAAWKSQSSNSGSDIYFDASLYVDPPYRGQALPNGGFFTRNTWAFVEYGVKPNTVAGPDALGDMFATYIDATLGRYKVVSTGLMNFWRSAAASATPSWNGVQFNGFYQDRPGSSHGVSSPPYLTSYMWDDFYLATGANARKRFLLGDASTLDACTALYIVPHSSWIDDSITFSLPWTQWPNLVGKHFFWFNDTTITGTHVGVGS